MSCCCGNNRFTSGGFNNFNGVRGTYADIQNGNFSAIDCCTLTSFKPSEFTFMSPECCLISHSNSRCCALERFNPRGFRTW